ncbi:S9 family peptidase [Phenylobacterium sp.]|uniref:alpha/beta hydrolase family protein n=1 Tax=Phenylobacterium sp. TaxID=1871053 RepID=UPI0025F8B574|nr:S9 family peptidase [Phenylobacterium sp.]
MRGLATAALAAVFGMAAAEAVAAPPPASAFGRIPAVVDAAISPNGQRVAILGGMSDQRVISIATIDQAGLPVLPLGEVETVSVRWAGDGFVLARIAYWETTGPRANYRFERNISITPDAKPAASLLDNDLLSRFSTGQSIAGVIAGPPARALVVGLSENSGAAGTEDTRIKRKGESGAVWSLWSVDPANGDGKLVERGNNDTVAWDVDRAGQPRIRLDVDEINHRFSVFARPGGKGSWTSVWKGGSFESRRNYYGWSEPDDAIYLMQPGGLVKVRLSDGAKEPLGKTGGAPSPWLVWDQHRNTAVGIGSGAERPTYEWLDPEIGAAANVLVRAFKAQAVQLAGWSADRTRFLARVVGPNSPGVWYLYDRPRKEISPLGDEYPELKGAALGTTRWMTYKARDGLEIPAYLTLPPGAQPGAKVPLVVYPHGGPKARDEYDFDFIAQFLATRGYAVLQPQFRGSWGFGQDFEDAGKGEWGGKMQTDLQDGVAALAASGDIDPKRVCIVGASFGGYAALAGAALYPDAYRCAASIAGVSDLGLLVVERGRTYGREGAVTDELRADLGAASSEKLMAHSPARQAGAVKAPILLIHGDKDTVVPIEQSKRMADVLKSAGKPHEFIVLEGENHYLTKSANRIRTLEALEAFLAKNLPVD